jgi:hypothetical protein
MNPLENSEKMDLKLTMANFSELWYIFYYLYKSIMNLLRNSECFS